MLGSKVPAMAEDMAWTLEPSTDLVLQLHMQVTGKAEPVQSSVAFYFTDAPSTRTLAKVSLTTLAIDIPAGERNYSVEDTFTLPVDAQILGILPHAHYLGKELKGFATLPDGTRKWLLLIRNWDFNWQDDYRFATPVSLPQGSVLTMQYSYDNSTNNVRNPRNPPERVRYGVQTTDEMAEFWVQLQLRGREELPRMEGAIARKLLQNNIAFNEYRLAQNPNDVKVHTHLGELLLLAERKPEALEHFRIALQIDPNYDQLHYNLGILFRQAKQPEKAREEFETTLRLNPEHSRAHGNLGFIFESQQDWERAEYHLRQALQLNPNDKLVLDALNEVLRAKNARSK